MSGGRLLGWEEGVTIYQVKGSLFRIKVEFETVETNGRMWNVFVYASNKERVRAEQQEEPQMKREQWGSKWILGGDFNDTRSQQEKNGGRVRNENSCNEFKDFILRMNMEKVEYQGRKQTWANNWKGYIEARLDKFFWVA